MVKALKLEMWNGLSQDRLGVRWPGGACPVADLDQRGDRQHGQHHQLDAQQDLLEVGGDLDPPVTDVGHHHDPQHADQQHPAAGRVRPDALGVEQQEPVLAGHLGQARHDQDVGGDDPPAARPSRPRAERARRPRERGAAVGVGLVQLAVADRAEQHGHEREDGDGRRLQPDEADHEHQRRGDAVGRRDGGGRDDGGGDQPKGARLEALVDLLLHSDLLGGHSSPFLAVTRPGRPSLGPVPGATPPVPHARGHLLRFCSSQAGAAVARSCASRTLMRRF